MTTSGRGSGREFLAVQPLLEVEILGGLGYSDPKLKLKTQNSIVWIVRSLSNEQRNENTVSVLK